jgi:hypothetical protein
MANEDCPCNGCVAPKRYPGCGIDCIEYKKWKHKETERKAQIREVKTSENECVPWYVRNSKNRRYR